VTAILAIGLPPCATRPLHAACVFTRGDADLNGIVQITDAIFVLNFLFIGGRDPACKPIADGNGDKIVNISDGIFLLGALFLGTALPPPLTEAEINECRGVDPEAAQRGEQVYLTPDAQGNLFSCALCHSAVPASEESLLRSAHTLFNALAHQKYKGGERTDFLGAANVCRADWMQTTPWQADNGDFLDLLAFIKTACNANSEPNLSYEIVSPAVTGPSSGSAEKGCKLFNISCALCHTLGGNADPQKNFFGPSLMDPLVVVLNDPDFLRQRIRLSGPNNPGTVYHGPRLLGTVMPFWTKDKLSDDDVEDVVAYIEARRAGTPGGDCAGRSGQLTGLLHNVGGTIEELSTKKIRITNFTYDGGGIDVHVWLFQSGHINQGTAIGDNLKSQPHSGDTLEVDIPGELTPHAYDSVSIWCVSAHQDFGSGKLSPVP
jgi:mono/diheme cytochrome c family protein